MHITYAWCLNIHIMSFNVIFCLSHMYHVLPSVYKSFIYFFVILGKGVGARKIVYQFKFRMFYLLLKKLDMTDPIQVYIFFFIAEVSPMFFSLSLSLSLCIFICLTFIPLFDCLSASLLFVCLFIYLFLFFLFLPQRISIAESLFRNPSYKSICIFRNHLQGIA